MVDSPQKKKAGYRFLCASRGALERCGMVTLPPDPIGEHPFVELPGVGKAEGIARGGAAPLKFCHAQHPIKAFDF